MPREEFIEGLKDFIREKEFLDRDDDDTDDYRRGYRHGYRDAVRYIKEWLEEEGVD